MAEPVLGEAPERLLGAPAALPRRVHIVGGPGSGKTTLARRIGALVQAPAYDLDEVAYDGGAGRKRTLEERLARLAEIAAQPAWVTEGIYLWWTDALMDAADLIVWLDLPYRIAAYRIVVRHLRADLAGNNRHPGLRNLYDFLLGVRWLYRTRETVDPSAPDDDGACTRLATARHLEPFAAKVARCARPADVDVVLRLMRSAAAHPP